jgi:hypothetical protein
MRLELQRAAVLRHGPHDILRHTVWHRGLDHQRYAHPGTHNARQVGDDFLCYPTRITPDTGCIELYWTVVTLRANSGLCAYAEDRRFVRRSTCLVATPARTTNSRPRNACCGGCLLRLLLTSCDIRLHHQAVACGLDQNDALAAPQSPVTPGRFIIAVGIGERLLLPEAALARPGPP